jgi:hypothetical protein
MQSPKRHVSKKRQQTNQKKQPPWPEYASDLYRPRPYHLSAKLVPILADRGCYVVSTTDPHGRILGFLDQNKRQDDG